MERLWRDPEARAWPPPRTLRRVASTKSGDRIANEDDPGKACASGWFGGGQAMLAGVLLAGATEPKPQWMLISAFAV